TGTKGACLQGECGTCTVLIDEIPTNSCITLALQHAGRRIDTIEYLASKTGGPQLQQAFISEGACQCGYCIPGMLMAAYALLNDNPILDDTQLRAGLEGNLCRCTGYTAICKAVAGASQQRAVKS